MTTERTAAERITRISQDLRGINPGWADTLDAIAEEVSEKDRVLIDTASTLAFQRDSYRELEQKWAEECGRADKFQARVARLEVALKQIRSTFTVGTHEQNNSPILAGRIVATIDTVLAEGKIEDWSAVIPKSGGGSDDD